jgi:hypothetical protein
VPTEPAVTGERVAEVADADERDRLPVVEPEGALQLVHQRRDLVPDPADAVGADVGQVLAQLRRVHAGGGGELVAGHRVGALLRELAELAEVDGEPGDAGLGDRPQPGGRFLGAGMRRLRHAHVSSMLLCPVLPAGAAHRLA